LRRARGGGTDHGLLHQRRPAVRAVRLELPIELHKQFRIEAAKEDTSMAAIARRLVEEWMAKRKGVGK
jgi:hypothetical protein